MNEEPKKTPPGRPHFGPGYHVFNIQSIAELSSEERRKVFEHILAVMAEEENKANGENSADGRGTTVHEDDTEIL